MSQCMDIFALNVKWTNHKVVVSLMSLIKMEYIYSYSLHCKHCLIKNNFNSINKQLENNCYFSIFNSIMATLEDFRTQLQVFQFNATSGISIQRNFKYFNSTQLWECSISSNEGRFPFLTTLGTPILKDFRRCLFTQLQGFRFYVRLVLCWDIPMLHNCRQLQCLIYANFRYLQILKITSFKNSKILWCLMETCLAIWTLEESFSFNYHVQKYFFVLFVRFIITA